VEVKVDLSCVGMGELTHLEVDCYQATNSAVIKEKMEVVRFVPDLETFLTVHKYKAIDEL